ncbi:PTS sugar transporter subunit IIB [Ligilactobacillus acidipiscis]|uniref:PTS sugar transporter subunit IIB n=1 Tax=Ligilactobacillus acidipiscis TaxID=89059 RepID=A0A921F649_9LACO|nr:PTS sugar transporter subunit IIB [Ligilactobacillus acidipiscis]WEV56521.1 PTS sugar transporter subunit IIB [Ligilactobacillus acidipiscis]HJE96031.1 PTS sugar transporter subunit IIB [Ligilactobacillus acidipiscis]
MKKILIACGSGIVTSTAVHDKVSKLLDENGFANQYSITQCKISETVPKSAQYDFLIGTTMAPEGLECDFISGIPFLTGMNTEPTKEKILELMKK